MPSDLRPQRLGKGSPRGVSGELVANAVEAVPRQLQQPGIGLVAQHALQQLDHPWLDEVPAPSDRSEHLAPDHGAGVTHAALD